MFLPGAVEAQDMIELGGFVRDIFKLNEEAKETSVSSDLTRQCQTDLVVFEVTNSDWNADKLDNDEFLASDGRVMDSMLT